MANKHTCECGAAATDLMGYDTDCGRPSEWVWVCDLHGRDYSYCPDCLGHTDGLGDTCLDGACQCPTPR